MKSSINPQFIKKMMKPKIKAAPKLGKSFKTLSCSKCSTTSVLVDQSASSVICHVCVTKMVGPTAPTISVTKYSVAERKAKKAVIAKKKADIQAKRDLYKDFPKGWWLKAMYTHKDGRKFQRGVEVKKFTVKSKPVMEKSGRPRGWHLHKKFTYNGVTYSFGKEVK